MNLWKIVYDSAAARHVAIVTGATEDDALCELRRDPRSGDVENTVVKRVLVIENVAQVIYNDSGFWNG